MDQITPPTPNGFALSSREDSTAFASRDDRDAIINKASLEELQKANCGWVPWARQDQLPPDGDWTTWLMLGGRGAGKTRAGAEWVKALALAERPAGEPPGRLALVGETLGDVPAIMGGGVSGLLAVHSPGTW